MSIRRVVVAVSGGVDSAVSAYILKTRGKRNINILCINGELNIRILLEQDMRFKPYS